MGLSRSLQYYFEKQTNHNWAIIDPGGMKMIKSWKLTLSCLVFMLLFLITIVITVSTAFTEPVQIFEDTLISTLGVGMSIFGLAITFIPFRRGEQWAWWVLWYWPIFLVIHIIALDTVWPDLPLAVLSVVALLLPFRSFFPLISR